jgi:hypothetical protein
LRPVPLDRSRKEALDLANLGDGYGTFVGKDQCWDLPAVRYASQVASAQRLANTVETLSDRLFVH